MLGDQWLADRAAEGKALAMLARPLARGHVGEAKAVLAALGVSLDDLDGFEGRQARCEIPGETGPDVAARPTAEALGHVFGRIAELPGASDEVRAAATRRDLEALGRAVGGVIYWTDALEDLKKDYQAGDFNPCVARERVTRRLAISGARVEACVRLLEGSLAELARVVRVLPLRRHRQIIESVLCNQLPRAARRAAAQARAVAVADAHARLAAMSWVARAAQRAFVILVVLWTWLLGARSVLAQDNRRRVPSVPPGAAGMQDAGPDADAGDADASGATPNGVELPWDWPVAPPASAGATPSATPDEQPPGDTTATPGDQAPGDTTATPGGQAPNTTGTPGTADPSPATPSPGTTPGGGSGPGFDCSGMKSCCSCDPCTKMCDGCCKGGCDSCCKGGCDGCCKSGDCCKCGGGGGKCC